MTRTAPATVDEYLNHVSSDAARETLQRLRTIIQSEIPQAEEVISYGIPTYKLHGMVVSFGAFKNHCSLFPGHTVDDFVEELKGYKTSRGTIQFPQDQMMPESLVRAIVRKRAEENAQLAKEREAGRKAKKLA